MKEKWVKLWAAALITLLLVPVYREMDDGGTREYAAALYRVTLCRTLTMQENIRGYMTGTEISILGMKVYGDVRFACDP